MVANPQFTGTPDSRIQVIEDSEDEHAFRYGRIARSEKGTPLGIWQGEADQRVLVPKPFSNAESIFLLRSHEETPDTSPQANPSGYCPDHGTGVACPVGLGVRSS